MTPHLAVRTNLAIVAIWSACCARAECPDYSTAQPATPVVNEREAKAESKLLKKWKSDEAARVVKFGAYVNEQGGLEGICCLSTTFRLTDGANRSLRNRLEALRFTPATYQGSPLQVFVNFTIVARKTDDGVTTRLLMNQQNSLDDFGLSYIAPQRIRAGSMWTRSRLSSGSVRVNVAVDVDSNGHASNARVNASDSTSRSIDETFASRVESACFVPGQSNGEPAAMAYAEWFGPG